MKALAPADALFLLMEHRRQPMHVAGLQLFTPPEGASRKFVAELAEEARLHTEAEKPWNQRLRFRLGRWYWDEDEQFDLDHHLRHIALPKPGRIRELLAYVSHEHSGLMDRSRPMWEMHLIEGLPKGRFAAYSKLHHALVDGMSAMKVAQSFFDPDPETRGRPPLWAMPPAQRNRVTDSASAVANPIAALQSAIGVNSQAISGLWSGLKDLFGPGSDTAVTPYQAPPTMFNVPISASRRFAADNYSMDRIKAVGKATGATLNDIVLAMCSGALREYLIMQNGLPNDPLIAMVPVSVRAADDPGGGNQVSVILANLATHIADPAHRLQTIVASTMAAKERMSQMSRIEQLAYAAGALSPVALTTALGYDKVHPPFNLVISNVPGPKQTMYWNGARLDEMYPLSIPIDGQAMNITLNSYDNNVNFGFTACSRNLPKMQRLLDFTEKALADLEIAAGLK